MTAPLREQMANNRVSTLTAGIDASTTSIPVADGTIFPSTGNYRIRIDNEIILVTSVSGDTLTGTRAQEGTTGAAHSNGADVQLVLTRDSLYRLFQDNIPLWGYSPALNKLVADDGSTLLTASSFTWVNQGSATASDQNGTILLTMPTSAGNNVRLLTRTAPSTPYVYVAGFQACMPRNGGSSAVQIGMGFRESSTGEFQLIQLGSASNDGPNTLVQSWTNATTFSANVRAAQSLAILAPVWWLKIEDNGTNLIYYVSADGIDWVGISTVGRTTLMAGGPDEVFFCGRNDANSGNETMIRLVHWSRES